MKYRSALPVLLMPLMLLTLNLDAHAQTESRSATLYRCGKDGRDLRDAPCPDKPKAPGTTVPYDQPSAADAQAARQQAEADAKRADAMQRARLKQEADQRRETTKAGSLSPAARPVPRPAAAPKPSVVKQPRPHKAHKPRKPKPIAG